MAAQQIYNNEIFTNVNIHFNNYTNQVTKTYKCVSDYYSGCELDMRFEYERIEIDSEGNAKCYWTFNSEIDYENWVTELAIERRNKKIDDLLND